MFDIKKFEEIAWRKVLAAAQCHGDRLLLAGALRNCDGRIPKFVRSELADLVEKANIPKSQKSKWSSRRATPARRYAEQIRMQYAANKRQLRTKKENLALLAKMAPALSVETIRDIVEMRKTFRGDKL